MTRHSPTPPFPFGTKWPASAATELACILEATAEKVGNVHPTASFGDMQYSHFLCSAISLRQSLESSDGFRTGKRILNCIEFRRRSVNCNTNLGMTLLIVPLYQAALRAASKAKSANATELQRCVADVLNELNEEDTDNIYTAIRVAQPGGLGKVSENDVKQAPSATIFEAMSQVADFDAVARQYTNAFEDVFSKLLPVLNSELEIAQDALQAIVLTQLRWLASEPDGLIHRKCGPNRAREVQQMAQSVIAHRDSPSFASEVKAFDLFLRSEGNRLNPGTTADLIAAALFVRLVCNPVI